MNGGNGDLVYPRPTLKLQMGKTGVRSIRLIGAGVSGVASGLVLVSRTGDVG